MLFINILKPGVLASGKSTVLEYILFGTNILQISLTGHLSFVIPQNLYFMFMNIILIGIAWGPVKVISHFAFSILWQMPYHIFIIQYCSWVFRTTFPKMNILRFMLLYKVQGVLHILRYIFGRLRCFDTPRELSFLLRIVSRVTPTAVSL